MFVPMLPFYISEVQGKVDIDVDPEDVANFAKIP